MILNEKKEEISYNKLSHGVTMAFNLGMVSIWTVRQIFIKRRGSRREFI